MIRSKLSLRRPLAVIGAAVLGLGAVTLVASPASAHHPEISGTFCRIQTSNDYKFSWTVGNSERDYEATITKVEPGPAGAIQVGATLPKKGQGAPLSGTVTRTALSRDALDKVLTVEARWVKPDRIITESRTVRAVSAGRCTDVPPTTPTPTPPAATPTPTPVPTTPAATTPPPATPTPTPSATLPPVEPVLTVEQTCEELTITFENPQGGKPFTFTATPNEGEPQTVTVEPGTTKTVTFPAEEGLEVVLSNEELGESEPIVYEQPEDCGGGGGGDLPLTGAAAGGIAAGAAVLLAAGVALFFVARRRRITFTA